MTFFYQVIRTDGELLSYDLETDTLVFADNDAGAGINAAGLRNQDLFAYGVFGGTQNLAHNTTHKTRYKTI